VFAIKFYKLSMYLLSLGLIFSLLGCGSTPVEEITKPPEPTITTPIVVKKWVQVGTWTATGKKSTESFMIEDGYEYRINWETFTPDKTLSLFIDDDQGQSLEMLIDVKGITKDSSYIRVPSGVYSLSQIVDSDMKWTATIEKR